MSATRFDIAITLSARFRRATFSWRGRGNEGGSARSGRNVLRRRASRRDSRFDVPRMNSLTFAVSKRGRSGARHRSYLSVASSRSAGSRGQAARGGGGRGAGAGGAPRAPPAPPAGAPQPRAPAGVEQLERRAQREVV